MPLKPANSHGLTQPSTAFFYYSSHKLIISLRGHGPYTVLFFFYFFVYDLDKMQTVFLLLRKIKKWALKFIEAKPWENLQVLKRQQQ